jgi:alpha-N-acetylglucosaminidase
MKVTNRLRIVLSAVLAIVPLHSANAGADTAARILIRRIVPQQEKNFVLEAFPADHGQDVFEIESRDGKIVLRGNTPVSVASALNRYLKEFCHADISHGCGNQLNLPKNLPAVPAKVRVVSPNKFRYAYNYCTHGYTMAWWDWPQWEKELDLLALNGINLALLTEGQEQVWLNALKQFGYTDAEVRQWLCLPTHSPWMYMSNLEGYGGPVPQSLIDRRVKLTQKIIARMWELGIEPILRGYYGMVPSTMHTKFPQAKIIGTGGWCDAKRPDMLYPTDPLYPKVADAYHQAQAKLFGTIKFLSGDPFHEGAVPADVNLAECGQAILASMRRAQPGVTWMLQAWLDNPQPAMLDGLDKSNLLMLDLHCERSETWRERKAFNGIAYLWCVVICFGGNNGIDGILQQYANKYVTALRDPTHGAMSGVGYMAEGTQTMPAIWELFLENAWRTQPVVIDDWVNEYIRRRYGVDSANARQAWAALLQLNYGHMSPGQASFNSVMQARPSLDPNQKARVAAVTTPTYPPSELVPVWKSLIDAAPECGVSDGYKYDLADLGRQVLSDLGTLYHWKILELRDRGDKAGMRAVSDKLLGLFDDVDALVGTRQEWLFGSWIRDARAWGATPTESDLCEHGARSLLTIWSEPTAVVLSDYANRNWSGLLGNFYEHRWQIWLDALNSNEPFNEAAVREDILKWELEWVRQTTPHFPAEPSGDVAAISRRLYKKYQGDASNPMFEAIKIKTVATTAADFIGRWRYRDIAGATCEMEFLPGGSAKLYQNGQEQDWKGVTWTFDKESILLKRPSGETFERQNLMDHDTMLFAMSGFRSAKRVAKPIGSSAGTRSQN